MSYLNIEKLNLQEVNIEETIEINGGGRIAKWAGNIVGYLHNFIDTLAEGHAAACYDGMVWL